MKHAEQNNINSPKLKHLTQKSRWP